MKTIITLCLLISFISGYGQGKEDENVPYLKNNKFVFCNHKLKPRIRATFDYARPFLYNYAIVGNNNHFGVINQDGKVIIPIVYTNISYKHSKYQITEHNKEGIYFSVNDDSAIFSVEGDPIFIHKTDIKTAENNIHKKKRVFKYQDKFGLVYGTDTIIKPVYSLLISNHLNEYLVAKNEDGFGIISHSTEIVLPFEYSEIFFDHTNAVYVLRKNDAENHCYFYHQSDDKNIYCEYKNLSWAFHDYYLVSNFNGETFYVNFYTGKEFKLK
jgi:hypothetical protein